MKELLHLSDDEVLSSILCDISFQYALGTTSFEEQPFSDRTMSRFRERLYLYELETGKDLLKEEVEALAENFIKFAKMNTSMRRMDSLMISSNCKKMSRLEIMYTSVANIIRKMNEQKMEIPEAMKHYLKEDDRNRVIYHEKGERVEDKLNEFYNDAKQLIREASKKPIEESDEYKLLERIIKEQTKEDEDGKQVLKNKKEITLDSVQSTTDPEATYRTKAGKKNIRYVGNVVETIDKGKAIISSYDYQQNNYSDIQFCKDEIEKAGKQEKPITMIGDGAYGGEDNVELAKENNINLVTTALLGKNPEKIVSDFEIKKEIQEVRCPAGQLSIKASVNKENKYRAIFDKKTCEECPFKDTCGVKFQKKSSIVEISQTMIDRANYVKKLETAEYREYGRKRNGVEVIPSILRRKYRVDQIPARGFVRSKMWFGFKILAINVRRTLNYENQRNEAMLGVA